MGSLDKDRQGCIVKDGWVSGFSILLLVSPG